MERLCQQDGGKEKLAAFTAALAEADRRLQWDADRLLAVLAREYPDRGKPRVVHLAALPMDLYSGTANFLFGSALENGNYAVASYERFTASFTGEPLAASDGNMLIDEAEIDDDEAGVCAFVGEDGVRCRNHARPGSRYCGVHAEFDEA